MKMFAVSYINWYDWDKHPKNHLSGVLIDDHIDPLMLALVAIDAMMALVDCYV